MCTCTLLWVSASKFELTWAMKLNRRKTEFLCNVCVLDLQGFVNLQDESEHQTINGDVLALSPHLWLTDFPFTHSVTRELEAMADPQPKVLNRASTILPFLSTSIWKRHAFRRLIVQNASESRDKVKCSTPNLKFHNIAAGWCTHQPRPHILGVLI